MPNLLIVNLTFNEFDNLDDFSAGEYYENLTHFYVSFLNYKQLPKLGSDLKVFSL